MSATTLCLHKAMDHFNLKSMNKRLSLLQDHWSEILELIEYIECRRSLWIYTNPRDIYQNFYVKFLI